MGNAGDIEPTSDQPTVGSVILLKEGLYGHAGVVLDFTDKEITITEANYTPGRVGTRILKRNYELIRGYRTYP